MSRAASRYRPLAKKAKRISTTSCVSRTVGSNVSLARTMFDQEEEEEVAGETMMSTLFSRDRQLVFTPYLHRVIKLSRSDQTQFAHVIASARPVLIFFSSLKEHKRINGHSPVRRILIMRWSTRVRGVY